jgi:hypothetical protein
LAFESVASDKIKDEVVESANIKNSQVTIDDILDSAVTSTDIAPGTVPSDGSTSAELKQRVSVLESQVASLQNQVNNLEISTRLEEVNLPIPANSFRSFFVPCNSDETLVGGGYFQDPAVCADNFIWESAERNSDGNNAYLLGYWNLEDEDVNLRVSALCGKIVSAQ